MEGQDQREQALSDAEEVTRMLGAHVPESLYWEFKRAAADRNEHLKDAIAHAARIYIDTIPKRGG